MALAWRHAGATDLQINNARFLIVFAIDCAAMRGKGHVFHRSENGVWFTDHVPMEFLRVIDEV